MDLFEEGVEENSRVFHVDISREGDDKSVVRVGHVYFDPFLVDRIDVQLIHAALLV